MDRRTRKDLKTDKFALEVGHTVEYITDHRSQVTRYGAILAAVLVIAGGIYLYVRHQATLREEALTNAIRINDAVISATPQPPNLNFPSATEKDKARTQAFMDLAAKFHGSQEGAIAQMYLGGIQLDAGKMDEAEKIYKDLSDSAPSQYAAVARLTLAQLYASEGKDDEAKKLLNGLIANPTVFVSKEEATLALAQVVGKTDRAAARKILEPLRASTRSTVSQAVVTELGKLAQDAPAN